MTVKQSGQTTLIIGVAGRSNVGKSIVFNLLTGLSQHVGNWPGKKVDRREGSCDHDGVALRLLDLPGTNSLTATSLEDQQKRAVSRRLNT